MHKFNFKSSLRGEPKKFRGWSNLRLWKCEILMYKMYNEQATGECAQYNGISVAIRVRVECRLAA